MIVEFDATPIVNSCNNENFKIYGCEVDYSKFPSIKRNKYGNVTITGNIPSLTLNVEHKIKATEGFDSRYGWQYKVDFVKRDRPTDALSTRLFLEEILTPRQANNLYEAYPDIVDRVIKNNLDDINLKLVHGVGEKSFKKIKAKIEENFVLIDLVEKFSGLITLNMLKKLLDKYKHSEKIIENLRNAPYSCLISLTQVGFKIADAILLKIQETSIKNVEKGLKPILHFKENLIVSKDRMKACIMFILNENELEGNTKMKYSTLETKCESLTPQCMNYFEYIIEDNPKDIYVDKKKVFASRTELFIKENFIAIKLNSLVNVKNEWDIDCENYRNSNGIKLIDKQMQGLEFVCKYNVMVIDGKSGSGKSSTIAVITKMLIDNRKIFKMMSPTGRAAMVLKRYSKLPATTIHRGLGFVPPNIWQYNENEPLGCDVVIIDEASMIDVRLMTNLLDAIDPTVTKLLLVGDSDQIPSVGAGNVFHDIINNPLVPKVTLDKVFRFDEGGLMNIATQVRLMTLKLQNEPLQIFGKNKDYMFVNCDEDRLIENLKLTYRNLLLQGVKVDDIYVLTAYNKGYCGTIEINKVLQSLANNYCNGNGLKVGDTTYYKNDLVIQIKNNYKAVIYDHNYINNQEDDDDDSLKNKTLIPNGESGRIVDINNENIIIQFYEHRICYKTEAIMKNIKLGYCTSIHKSQGGENEHIIVLTPKAHTYMLNSNLLYVALTRTKKKCYHLGNYKTVNLAVKKKANFDRKTFLKDILQKIDVN